MRLEAMAITMPEVGDHPNRISFEGVLTTVDEASTRPPSGARGHRVILTQTAAREALPSLLGMAVDYAPKWDGHDARAKCGIITEADVIGNQLQVGGYLFGRDFPEVVRQLQHSESGSMGMSYELADAHVADMRAEVWTLTRAIFTGAAILLREKAAYRNTSFRLSAGRCRNSNSLRESNRAKLAARSGRPFETQFWGQTKEGRKRNGNR
ncbi:hypothetical protein [Alloacidobacterium dinghuense]|uniref:hypothetical protein n=1 Tax=Alloacidobacterium dinghuense TaxID=2763107 RepID=UPI002036BB10|nr:hypothetical protein [Alloacidobacterium dinghuense]